MHPFLGVDPCLWHPRLKLGFLQTALYGIKHLLLLFQKQHWIVTSTWSWISDPANQIYSTTSHPNSHLSFSFLFAWGGWNFHENPLPKRTEFAIFKLPRSLDTIRTENNLWELGCNKLGLTHLSHLVQTPWGDKLGPRWGGKVGKGIPWINGKY